MPDATRAPGKVVQLGHIVLTVADLQRSLEFYEGILGWPVIFRSGAFAAGFRAGHTHHDLLLIEAGSHAPNVPSGSRLGLRHFGVKVGDSDDDLRALLIRLQSRPDLAQVGNAIDAGFVHSLYVTDPDGNEVELYVDLPGSNWDDPDLLSNIRWEPLLL